MQGWNNGRLGWRFTHGCSRLLSGLGARVLGAWVPPARCRSSGSAFPLIFLWAQRPQWRLQQPVSCEPWRAHAPRGFDFLTCRTRPRRPATSRIFTIFARLVTFSARHGEARSIGQSTAAARAACTHIAASSARAARCAARGAQAARRAATHQAELLRPETTSARNQRATLCNCSSPFHWARSCTGQTQQLRCLSAPKGCKSEASCHNPSSRGAHASCGRQA